MLSEQVYMHIQKQKQEKKNLKPTLHYIHNSKWKINLNETLKKKPLQTSRKKIGENP